VDLPSSADELRERITQGNREQYGAPANVHTRMAGDDHVRRERVPRRNRTHVGPGARPQLTDGQSLL
jgi:magnesium chelatase subunit H